MLRESASAPAGAGARGGVDIAGRRYGTCSAAGARAPACPVDLAEIRFRRAVARLHRLGPRVLAEIFAEIGAKYLIRHPIEATVERYLVRLDRAMLAAAGGDRMPPVPSPRLVPVAICARI